LVPKRAAAIRPKASSQQQLTDAHLHLDGRSALERLVRFG
jgi:hypothetical protein